MKRRTKITRNIIELIVMSRFVVDLRRGLNALARSSEPPDRPMIAGWFILGLSTPFAAA
jgi:hypothetical protein